MNSYSDEHDDDFARHAYEGSGHAGRNSTFGVITATVVVMLLIGAGVGTAMMQRQSALRAQAEQLRAEAAVAKQLAIQQQKELEEARQKTAQALRDEKAALARKNAALRDTEAAIDNYVKGIIETKLLNESRFKPLKKVLLQDAREHYERLLKEQPKGDPEIRKRTANALKQLGQIQSESNPNSLEPAIASATLYSIRQQDPQAVQLDEQKLVEHTVASLRAARDAGFFNEAKNVERLKNDKRFDPLRQRPEFQKFVKSLKPAGSKSTG